MTAGRTPLIVALALLALGSALPAQARNLARAADELLAADRAFAAAAVNTDFHTALNAMFADDIVMPAPGVGFADGRAAVMTALRRDTLNATSRISWTPIRAGISGDGTHGYTLGFIETTRADGAKLPGKYLAYWIRGAEGWRVAVYRRTGRPAGAIDSLPIESLLPARVLPPLATDASINEARTSLAKAESDFSALASEIGIGAAFERFGDAEAMHISGGPTVAGFVRGNVNIGRAVGGGDTTRTSPVVWAADHRTIVAPSGDFGVNIGWIKTKELGPDGQPRTIPFFTIWRRADLRSPWRYIAE
jgi:ketosteroid isomerase-like protein